MGDVGDQHLATAGKRITEFIAEQIAGRSRTHHSKLLRSPVVTRLVKSHVCRAKTTEITRILYRHLQAHVRHQATLKRTLTSS